MIERRFKTNEVGCIVDLKDKQLRNYDGEEIVDLLNEQHEENEELKKAYDKLRHYHSNLHDECIELECERDGLKKDVEWLEKENEQLKQRINSRLHYYRELYNHFDKNDGFSYNIVEKVVEDLEDILR